MGFKQDGYATIWKIEDKGNYHEVNLSTSKKNKETNEFDTDFSAFGVRFIGTAHTLANEYGLTERDRIKIGSCEVSNKYDKEKKVTYTNYCVFSFEKVDNTNIDISNAGIEVSKKNTTTKFVETVVTDDSEDNLPF